LQGAPSIGSQQHERFRCSVDHYEALQWTRGLAAQTTPIGEGTVCELHRRIVARSQPAIAGIYSPHPRRIAGSSVIFPNPLKILRPMEEFGTWLLSAPSTPEGAFEAHFRFTAIHRFSDGNLRAARLLMNLMLIRGGYPPAAVPRKPYLDGLERGSLTDDPQPFRRFMYERLDATLGEYLSTLQGPLPQPDPNR
jgi:Fic family protein